MLTYFFLHKDQKADAFQQLKNILFILKRAFGLYIKYYVNISLKKKKLIAEKLILLTIFGGKIFRPR